MSRKSRHEYSKVYVKRVENLTDEEWEKSPLMVSLRKAAPTNPNGNGYRLNVATDDGGLVQRKFKEISWGKDAFKNAFSEESTLVAVKLTFSDGSTEYGFKCRESKTIVNRKNAILEPIFIREGMWDDYLGRFVDCPKDVVSTRKIPAWLLKRIPMYSEKIRDRVTKDEWAKYNETQFEDVLHRVMTSDLVSNWAVFGKPPSDTHKKGDNVAYRTFHAIDLSNNYQYYQYQRPMEYGYRPYDDWNESPRYYIVKESIKNGPNEIEMGIDPIKKQLLEEMTKQVVYLYRYVKSIYRDQISRRKVYTIMPISNVLTIERMKNWNDDTTEEVWNNLDQAVLGNV